ncbi:hypothetical protein GCM10009664_64960 [Kitasatospora gansuensis]
MGGTGFSKLGRRQQPAQRSGTITHRAGARAVNTRTGDPAWAGLTNGRVRTGTRAGTGPGRNSPKGPELVCSGPFGDALTGSDQSR